VTPEPEGAQIIDLCAARRLKQDLADVERPIVDGVAPGQLSLDPMPAFEGANSTVIGGTLFTCTTWAGSPGGGFPVNGGTLMGDG
jgi:hypothetical protein